MASWLRAIRAGLFYRKVLGELTGMRAALERQNDLLQILVSHLAPETHLPDAEELGVTTGVSHLDEREMGLVLDFEAQMQRQHGRGPTDHEVMEMLAWQETQRSSARG